MLEKKEVGLFALAALVVGYAFSFKELLAGDILTWLKMSGYSFITILASSLACEIAAAKFGFDAEFRLWSIDIRLRKKARFSRSKPWFIPAWLIFPVALILVSWGLKWLIIITWLAVVSFDAVPAARFEKKFINITEWELALIALAGPMTAIVIAVIAKFFGLDALSTMSVLYAIFNLLPISELNGIKVFFGSMMLWIFSFIFAIMIFILLGITNITTTIIAAIITAFLGVLVFYMLHEAK